MGERPESGFQGVILPIQGVHGRLARIVGAPTRDTPNGSTRTDEDNLTSGRTFTERRNSSLQCSDNRVHVDLEVRPPRVQGCAG